MDYFINTLIDVLGESALDCLKMLPILYLSYLLMELLEHRASGKMRNVVVNVDKAGPAIGAALGIVPQCGFSGAVAGLYAGGVASLGTLISVFMATSDEMLPLLISSNADAMLIIKILLGKLLCGMLCGFAVDLIFHRKDDSGIHDLCEQEHCSCDNHNTFVAALIHTAQIIGIIFSVSVGIGMLFELCGDDILSVVPHIPVVGELLAGLVGLVPNCAVSVLFTELFLSGTITSGVLLSGLAVNAGVGLLVLFRLNRNIKDNLRVIAVLYVCGVVSGLLLGLLI